MQKIIHVKCPKCNNNQHFHKFGKDKFGNQKYRCLDCGYQFAPDFQPKTRMRKYPPCPVCGKSSFYTTIKRQNRVLLRRMFQQYILLEYMTAPSVLFPAEPSYDPVCERQ